MSVDSGRSSRSKIDRLLSPLSRFMAIEAASGAMLLVCAIVALVVANSAWSEPFARFWQIHLRIGLGSWELDESLLHWINDGLMTIFFFVVGLEIKREIVAGELRDPRKAALPLMAAIGGMLAPALVYVFMLRGEASGQSGWAIPMATDIAFVVGFLALLGNRVPPSLKIFLLALAIADDMGAILVIALFYSSGVSGTALSFAAMGMALTLLFHWLGVRNIGAYLLIGAAIWLAMLHSGIHPTVSGVILGLLTPALPVVSRPALLDTLSATAAKVAGGADSVHAHGLLVKVRGLSATAIESVSPLERLEAALHPWVAFVIMPLFALANAGVKVDVAAIGHPIAWSVALGLVIGKPLGILLFSWLAVVVGLARLPSGVNWITIAGAGCLAGIGFTMSLFIANLALEGHSLHAGKIGTLAGSAISATLGTAILYTALPRRTRDSSDDVRPK